MAAKQTIIGDLEVTGNLIAGGSGLAGGDTQYKHVFDTSTTIATIQSSISNLANGESVFFKNGTYVFGSEIVLSGNGKMIVGQSTRGVTIQNTSSHTFKLSGEDHQMHNLTIEGTGSLGRTANTAHLLRTTSPGIDRMLFQGLRLIQPRYHNSVFKNIGGVIRNCRFVDCYAQHSELSTVPMWHLFDAAGVDDQKARSVSWNNCHFEDANNYVFLIEASAGSSQSPENMIFENVLFTDCPKGLINCKGVRGLFIRGLSQGAISGGKKISVHQLRLEGSGNNEAPDTTGVIQGVILGGTPSSYNSGIRDLYFNSDRNPKKAYLVMEGVAPKDPLTHEVRIDYNNCIGVTELGCEMTQRASDLQINRVYDDGIFTVLLKMRATQTSDDGLADDTSVKKVTIQRMNSAPVNAGYIKFNNSPGTPTTDFYLMISEG